MQEIVKTTRKRLKTQARLTGPKMIVGKYNGDLIQLRQFELLLQCEKIVLCG